MIVEHINNTLKAKGSEDLRRGLQNGDLKRISERFNVPYMRVSAIIRGRQFGETEIVECAERMVAFYKEVDLQTNVEQILESYEPIN